MSRNRRRTLERIQDVIAGRYRASLHELFDLIHAVNPTGRADDGASARATARDYQLKARLQSLLVRDHRDELRVTAEPDGSIGIAHRYSNRDACHARLDSLDDDARAWIRWQLDTADAAPQVPPSSHAPARRADPEPDDPLARGRRALAEYDFDAAVSLFREAFEASGDAETARALLEVLVDSLAQDAEALALEPELDDAASADPEVRSLLGLAAARSGELDHAARWLARTTAPRAVEAWGVLAQSAIAQGELPAAERALGVIEQLDPANPAIPQLRTELAQCRAALRRPEEEALQAAMAAGDEHAAEVQARSILSRWPDSAVAGRTLAAIEARRRERTAEQNRKAAADALDEGDLTRARELAHRAAAYGAVVRTLNAGRYLVSIPGDEPLFGALDADAGATFHTGRGSSAGELSALSGRQITAIVRHPDGAGFVVAASRPDVDEEVALYEVAPGRPLVPLAIRGSDPDHIFWLHSARGRGLVFVYAHTLEGPELGVVRMQPEGMEVCARVPAPRAAWFAHDLASRRGYVIWFTNQGVRVSELDARLPNFGADCDPFVFPSVAPHFFCAPAQGPAPC
jgi:hypothetical protein